MSGQAVIGGNLQAIEDSASRLTRSADMAIQTGTSTSSAAVELEAAITEAMNALMTKFDNIAQELTADINASHQQLVGTDWQGASRDNAIAIKERLQGQINKVLGEANTNLGLERDAFNSRAGAIVQSINSEFKTVMNQIDVEYNALADASRKTRDNLLAADATIQMG